MAYNPFEEIKEQLIRLEGHILDMKHSDTVFAGEDRYRKFLDVQGLQEYLPTHPSKSTIYRWVSQKTIPHIKRGKSLYFDKQVVDDWLRGGGQETQDQIKDRTLRVVNGASKSLKRA